MIEPWLLEKLNPLKGERIILLHDPQRMIRSGAVAVDDWAKQHNFVVIFPSGNLGFRDQYEQVRGNPDVKIILVDRTREDARLPLFYPDLESRCSKRARLKITLRDFLIDKTGDERWPQAVNTRNLSRLILVHLNGTQKAYNQLRDAADSGRFTDSDLYKIVLGSTLDVNPFKKLSPQEIRKLCIERHERMEEVRKLFASSGIPEAESVLDSLKEQVARAERPWCWMLENDPQDVVRAFTLACILHQHDLDYEVILGNLDYSLSRFKDIPKETIAETTQEILKADPDGMAADVQQVEAFLKEEPKDRLAFLLANRCQVDDLAKAKKVLLAEKLSPLIRTLSMLSLLVDLITNQKLDFHKDVLAALDKEGEADEDGFPLAARRPTPQWSALLTMYRRAIRYFEIAAKLHEEARKLKVARTDQLEFEWFHRLWTKECVDRLDYYGTELERLLRVGDLLPVPTSDLWPKLCERLDQVKKKLKDAVAAVDADLNIVNGKFQDMYRTHYVDWIKGNNSPVVFTHQFIPKILKHHWDVAAGQKAVILIFDGLRTDAWEELVRPVLEEKYDTLEEYPASAILPSETHLSRKAISAGCLPINFASTNERNLLQYALKDHLNLDLKLVVEREDEGVESGISARYTSGQLEVVIFNFTDKNLHNTHQDLSFIYANTVKAIVQQDVRSVLREMPDDAVVFVTSDHGFSPVPNDTFQVPQDRLTDSGDVKYRVGRLRYPLEEQHAKQGVSFKVEDMGIPDEIRKSASQAWRYKHVMFPRPGLTLKRPSGRHDPERYTHGGLSMAECLIPLYVLGPKVEFEPAFALVDLTFEGATTEGETIDIVVTAKARAKDNLFGEVEEDVLFQLDTNLDEVQARKEVFSGDERQYRVRWKPRTDSATPEEQESGRMRRHVTVVASYRWKDRSVKSSIHKEIEITLDTSRIRRRLDSKLDSIMGMVPKELR